MDKTNFDMLLEKCETKEELLQLLTILTIEHQEIEVIRNINSEVSMFQKTMTNNNQQKRVVEKITYAK